MAFKPSLNVGFASNQEDQSYIAIDFLANPYGRVAIRPRIISLLVRVDIAPIS